MSDSKKFTCKYCSASFGNIAQLLKHYETEHKDKPMKRYSIEHRPDRNKALISAPSAQEACQACGWMIGDCYIREVT